MVYLIEKCQGQTRIDMTDLSLADKNEFSQNFQMTMVSLRMILMNKLVQMLNRIFVQD